MLDFFILTEGLNTMLRWSEVRFAPPAHALCTGIILLNNTEIII